MAVIIKCECQKCEAVHEDELDGVLILGYQKREDGAIGYPHWYHDMPVRQAVVGFLDYLKSELEDMASDIDMEPYKLLVSLIQEGKISLE